MSNSFIGLRWYFNDTFNEKKIEYEILETSKDNIAARNVRNSNGNVLQENNSSLHYQTNYIPHYHWVLLNAT